MFPSLGTSHGTRGTHHSFLEGDDSVAPIHVTKYLKKIQWSFNTHVRLQFSNRNLLLLSKLEFKLPVPPLPFIEVASETNNLLL